MDKGKRQVVSYTFFKVAPDWRRLSAEEKACGRREFAAIVEEYGRQFTVRTYSTVGTRADADFMLWRICPSLEPLREMTTALLTSKLGSYLTVSHNFLAMTRRSIYVDDHRHEGQEGVRLTVEPGGGRYLFVYPFVKTREWYLLTQPARRGMMNEHIAVGHRYPSVRLNTAYSFGLDDQEFVVAFETDEPADFVDLVMELRGTEASRYTLRDTPIFTCMAMPALAMLEAVG